MIIGLTNQKGGAGKTTVSGHLAYWLSQRGTVMIVDADAQQSSTRGFCSNRAETYAKAL